MAGLCKGGNEPPGSLKAIKLFAGEMSPRSSTESYLAFAHIGLRENPGKKPQPGNFPSPGIESGPPGFAARRANHYSTGVDYCCLVNCSKTGLNLTSDTKKAPLLRQLGQEIIGRTHRHDTTVHDVIRLLIPALYKNQSDSLMAADGDCHQLCKLMAPVRDRWSINDAIGDIRNTVGYDGRDWINLAQDRDRWRAYVRAAMDLQVP
ncbi:hypothetical protein ANN_21699 [Periplaneta americana]|uniref:Uncharacterized protein n=1 Tax=Periplaneta americana TaxID=6978 RepID=A0ABQ8S6N4_PERAM|nr:hypothetical protein ANN_21699 [Periplaneta americana]